MKLSSQEAVVVLHDDVVEILWFVGTCDWEEESVDVNLTLNGFNRLLWTRKDSTSLSVAFAVLEL